MNSKKFHHRVAKFWIVFILLCLLTVNAVPVASADAMKSAENSQTAGVNEPPQVMEGDQVGVTMSMNGYPQPFMLDLHATDANNDSLIWRISTPAQYGAASISGTGTTITVNYTPNLDFTGMDSFVVEVADKQGGTDFIVVNVTITPLPEIQPQETVSPEPRIVGGGPADPGEYPWQVALVRGSTSDLYNDQFCGGSLIAPQWVLTAAHCITDGTGNVRPASYLDAVAGIYNLATPAAGYQRRDVLQIIRHPSYNDSTFNHDLALLKLATPVSIGGSGATKTAIIPLVPASIGDLAGVNSWVTGWGNTESTPLWPTQLYEVQVPIIANSVCNNASHYNGSITSNMLCAGFDAGGHDSCQGDSGGPLIVSHSGQWKLAGIVSWGDGCADPNRQGVYTRVSQYVSWINSKIGNNAPGSFNKLSPSTGATDLLTSLTLQWNASTGAVSYAYCYDTTNNNVCDGSWISNGANTSVAINGLNTLTDYYWQVKAINSFGETEADDNQWFMFTTGSIVVETEIFGSNGADDGWILESTEISGVGGTLNKNSTTLRVGDDAANKQYRSVLSFDTPALPEGAVITSVTLKFKYQGKTGTLPFSTHGKLLADMCKGPFRGNPALQLNDFNGGCPSGFYKAKALLYTNTPADNWYSQSLLPEDFQFINLGGVTQFRLRFATDDNNDRGADFLKLYSGNADVANHPQLVIEYYIP